MTDWQDVRSRAVAFVVERGDDLSAHRANALAGRGDAQAAIALLPGCREGAEPRVGELLRSIGVLDELRALDSRESERCCASLGRRQADDGSFADDASAGEGERIFATGMIAGYLAKTPFVRQSTLAAAADYVAALWDPSRVKGAAWGATAACFHCFALVRHEEADAILQWCGRELERGFRSGLHDAVRTAKVFALCRAHALPGARLTRQELAAAIAAEQRPDGGFRPADDDNLRARVAHTLDALFALSAIAPTGSQR